MQQVVATRNFVLWTWDASPRNDGRLEWRRPGKSWGVAHADAKAGGFFPRDEGATGTDSTAVDAIAVPSHTG